MKKNKKVVFTAKRIAFDAVLTALYYVLSVFTTIKIGQLGKISFDGLPILLAGFLFGPIDGLIVGLVGSLLDQIVSYGLMLETPIWLLADTVRGLIAGLVFYFKKGKLKPLDIFLTTLVTCVIVTTINTFGLVAVGYLQITMDKVFVILGLKLLNSIVTAIIFALIIIPTLKPLNKYSRVIS